MALIEFYRDKDGTIPLGQLLGTHKSGDSFVKSALYPSPDRMIVVNNPWNFSTETLLTFNGDTLTNPIGDTDPGTGNQIIGYVYSEGDTIFEGQSVDTNAEDNEDRLLKDKFWIFFNEASFNSNQVIMHIGPNEFDSSVFPPGIGIGSETGEEPTTYGGNYVDYGYNLSIPEKTDGDKVCIWVRYVAPKNGEFGRFFNVSIEFKTNIDF